MWPPRARNGLRARRCGTRIVPGRSTRSLGLMRVIARTIVAVLVAIAVNLVAVWLLDQTFGVSTSSNWYAFVPAFVFLVLFAGLWRALRGSNLRWPARVLVGVVAVVPVAFGWLFFAIVVSCNHGTCP
jgi:hypothetical protein